MNIYSVCICCPSSYVGFQCVPSLLTIDTSHCSSCILTLIPTPTQKKCRLAAFGVCSVDRPGQLEKGDKVAHTLTFGVQGLDRGRVCGGENLVE